MKWRCEVFFSVGVEFAKFFNRDVVDFCNTVGAKKSKCFAFLSLGDLVEGCVNWGGVVVGAGGFEPSTERNARVCKVALNRLSGVGS